LYSMGKSNVRGELIEIRVGGGGAPRLVSVNKKIPSSSVAFIPTIILDNIHTVKARNFDETVRTMTPFELDVSPN
jgi:hypothetical protein